MSIFTETTQHITVSVSPAPIEEECHPGLSIFAFAYTIRIENQSSETVQLMERHWLIESADRPSDEVTGSGVVGVQPILRPGERFEYTSSTVINDPIGSMRGTYLFRRVTEGGFFQVQIPRFRLLYAGCLN